MGDNRLSCDDHTPSPDGYIQWHAWAEQMSKTHRCVQCPECGLYAIWLPKRTPPAKAPPIAPKSRGGRKCIYPFAEMGVDGYFERPRNMGVDSQNRDRRQNSIISSARKWARRNAPEAKFTTRLLPCGTKVGCWRES